MLRLFLSSFIDGSPPVLRAPSILSEKIIFVLDNGKGKEFRKLPFVANLFDMVFHSLIMEHDDLICCENKGIRVVKAKEELSIHNYGPPHRFLPSSPHISCFLPNDANGTKQAVQVFKSNKLRPSGIVSGYKRNSQHDLLDDFAPPVSVYLVSLTSVTVGKLTRMVVNVSQYPWYVLRNVCINTRQAWISTHNSP